MAVKEILKKGNDVLKRTSKHVKEIDESILNLVKDMKDTLDTVEGIGLAAPQIGVNKRVILIDLRDDTEPIVLINPKMVSKTGTQDSEEACLSYPGYYGYVKRPEKIIVRGINLNGEKVEYRASDLLCRVFCHEIDHLDGILYTDRAHEMHKD